MVPQQRLEYITELDAPLTETGPFYTDVQPGNLVYYNPDDSLTIIYEETGSVLMLTKMGEITSDLAPFRDLPNNIDIRIERGRWPPPCTAPSQSSPARSAA